MRLPRPDNEAANVWDFNKYNRMGIPNEVDMKHHSGKATKYHGKPWVGCNEQYNPECCAPHIFVDCEGDICERHIGKVLPNFLRAVSNLPCRERFDLKFDFWIFLRNLTFLTFCWRFDHWSPWMTSKLSFWTAYVDLFNHVCNLYSFESNLLRFCISFILMFNLGFLISFDVWYLVNRPGITLKKGKITLGIDTIIVGGVIFGKWIRDPFLIVVGTTALRGTTDELVKSPLQTEFISSGAKRFRG